MTDSATRRLGFVLFIFLALFAFSSTFSIALAQSTLGVSLVLFVIIAVSSGYNPVLPQIKWFYIAAAAYVAWMIIVSAAGPTPSESLSMIREEWLFLAIPVGIYVMQDERRCNQLMVTLAVGMTLVTMFAIYQYIDMSIAKAAVEPGVFVGPVRVRGNFSHVLTFGNYSAVAALLLLGYGFKVERGLSARSRWIILLGGAAGAVSSVLTFSRGPMLALFAVLVLLLFFLKKRQLLVVVPLFALLVAYAVFFSESGRSRFTADVERDTGDWKGSRLYIWDHSLTIIKANPLMGIAPGNFQKEYAKLIPEGLHEHFYFRHAHSDPINFAVNAGIPGLLLYLGVWLAVMMYLWRGFRRAAVGSRARAMCLAALLASLVFWLASLTESAFADEEVRQMLMFVWAFGLSGWLLRGSETKSSDRSFETV
ncbi:MAG: O-antigen ligase family protein [candidate division Zixibacteria bacterium]|nr:O-antigen ligase family protein [candidate division Zixibacteria bacterium]